jgi:hypothetical protein
MAPPHPPPQHFTLEEFQALRRHSDEPSAIAQLTELGRDITRADPEHIVRGNVRRVCFICANTYPGDEKRGLGVGPINDAIVVAANHKVMNYDIYAVINPTVAQYLKCLKLFLSRTTDYLTVYFTGHGALSQNYDGTEASGFDQNLVFPEGHIKDDELAKCLKDYAKGIAKILLLNDCCHSGTIWDIPTDLVEAARTFPPGIVSFSAAQDSETAKQATIDKMSQGLFTYYFWKFSKENPGITLEKLTPMLNAKLKEYNQETSMTPTRQILLRHPLFPQD